MRAFALSILLLAALAGPARAESTAVAPDGTQVRASVADGASPVALARVYARMGDRPAQEVGALVGVRLGPVAATRGGSAMVTWSGSEGADTARTSDAAFARSDGSFGPAEEIGPGDVRDVAMNARGEAAVLVGDVVAFRPAGGTFGTPVAVPERAVGVTLTATGETIVSVLDAAGLSVVTRKAGGPLTTPQVVLPGAQDARVVPDGQGRALAAGLAGDQLVTAVRRTDGSWSPAASTAVGPAGFLAAAVNAKGDAVVGVRGPESGNGGGGGPVLVFTGTLPDPALAGPTAFDGAGFGLSVGVGTDGSAAVAYGQRQANEVRVVRRQALGPFGAPIVAECGVNGGTVLAVLDDGRTLLDGAFYDPSRPPDCSAPSPLPDGAVSKTRLIAGDTAVVDLGFLAAPGLVLDWVGTTWNDGGIALPAQPGDRPGVIRRVFPRPGRVHLDTLAGQHQAGGCCAFVASAPFDLDVFARATLRLPRQSLGSARRHGLLVQVSAFTAGAFKRVTVRVRRRGRTVGRRTVRAGLPRRRIHVPLRPRVRGSVRVVLRQNGRKVAKPVVVAL